MTMNPIKADWPAPANVMALTTTRLGGASVGAYQSFNLTDQLDDDPQAVAHNRAQLQQQFHLRQSPHWLRQVHGTQLIELARHQPHSTNLTEADGSYTREAGPVCAVMTADCIPALFCNRQGTEVAAAHAGWRGLCAGILEKTVATLKSSPKELFVWLGPCIGPKGFIVDAKVRDEFMAVDPQASQAFTLVEPNQWAGDLIALAKQRLANAGVNAVYGGRWCTYTDAERFYSYRRDQQTGRMASLIWINS